VIATIIYVMSLKTDMRRTRTKLDLPEITTGDSRVPHKFKVLLVSFERVLDPPRNRRTRVFTHQAEEKKQSGQRRSPHKKACWDLVQFEMLDPE
jgi:hypothetical protein